MRKLMAVSSAAFLLLACSFPVLADPPSPDELTAAIKKADVDMVLSLLKNGASIKGLDKSGFAPLVIATMVAGTKPEALKIVDLLLEAGADIEQFGPVAPLDAAVRNGPPKVVAHLIDKGANVNARYTEGRTALFQSVRRGTGAAAELLIRRGANVNAKTVEGITPMHMAAINGMEPTVLLLLEYGAYINARDNEGKTPLSWAKGAGPKFIGGSVAKAPLLELLLANGATE